MSQSCSNRWAKSVAPTLFTSCNTLPPEGALSPWGGPAVKPPPPDTTMHQAASQRYDTRLYRRVGVSGLKLPAASLGLWHNFGEHMRRDFRPRRDEPTDLRLA